MDKAIGRPAWLAGWVGMSVVGFVAGFMLVFIGGWALVEAATGDAERILDDGWGFWIQLTIAFALAGAGWAGGQWLLLRRRVDAAGRWILGGAAGFALLAVLYLVLYERVPTAVNEVVHSIAAGLVMGAVQLPVVHRLVGRSRGWVVVAVTAMLLGAGLSALLRTLGLPDDLGQPIAVAAMALLTGLVLRRWAAAGSGEAPPADRSGPARRRVSTVAVLTILLIASLAVSARAFNPQPDPPMEMLFGMVGITSGDVLRLNVVSVDNPELIDNPNLRCTGQLDLIGLDGATLASRPFDVAPGQGSFLEYRIPSGRGAPAVAHLRPMVAQAERGECQLLPTLEMLDAKSLQTRFLHPGILRGFNPQPDPPHEWTG